jgi:hypothetical protein
MTWLRALIKQTGVHAYPEDYQYLLTQPADPQIGVTTSDDGGEW